MTSCHFLNWLKIAVILKSKIRKYVWILYILIAGIALVSWLVSNRLQSKFDYYSKIHLRNGMSGAEIAEQMLRDHGIYDVKVISTPGRLTDHYNPVDKTVNLSKRYTIKEMLLLLL